MRGRRDRSLEDAIARRVFVGQDVELAFVGLGEVEELFAGGDAQRRLVVVQVFDEELILRPALLDHDAEPAAVLGDGDVGPVLRIAAGAEDERVVCRIAAERMIEDVPVVHLLTGRDFARLGIARVVEAAVVGLPGNAGCPRASDGVGQQLARRGLDDLQRAHLGATLRRSVGDILAVVRNVPPVESDRAVLGKLVDVEQRHVGAVHAFADVEHSLVLLAVATGVEVVVAADLSLEQAADFEQVLDAVMQLIAAGKLVENAARVGEQRGDLLLGLGALAIFEPAIRVDNLAAEVFVGDRLLRGCRRLGKGHRGRRRVGAVVLGHCA